MRCDACASYEKWDGGVGRCHLMPPASVRDARNEMWTPFPLVNPDWWCSQYVEKQRPHPAGLSGAGAAGGAEAVCEPSPLAVQPTPLEDEF